MRPGPRRAFSLVEIVLVLAIMAVLAAIAAPRYGASIANYRALLAAHRLASDVTLARSAARAASASRSVVLDVNGGSYSIPGLAALDGRGSGYAVKLADAPYSAAIKSVVFTNPSATTTLTFDGFGVPDGGATIVVGSGNWTRTVLVDAASGAATVK